LEEQELEVRPAAEICTECPSVGGEVEIREQTKEIKGKRKAVRE
jgi:hypothetical protein